MSKSIPAVQFANPVATRPASVLGQLAYVGNMAAQPAVYVCDPPAGEPAENFPRDVRLVAIHDIRAAKELPSLDVQGFEYLTMALPSIDFQDADQIRGRYYPMMERLALDLTKGSKARVFDHLVRSRSQSQNLHDFGRRVKGVAANALGHVHNDYSEASGRLRLQMVLGDPAAVAAVRHYCIINLWRSIGGVIEDTPLALCDARSVAVQDLVPSRIHYADRVGEILLSHASEKHRWSYMGEMGIQHLVAFKQFDSRIDGVPRFVPHCAFDLPTAAAAKIPRRSIEVRVLVVFD
jgi:hypothetical protein